MPASTPNSAGRPADIGQLIDSQHNFTEAAQAVRRLMFLDKTREDVERAIDALMV